MATKDEKKFILLICGVIIFLLLAIFFGLHILAPALEPVTKDMIKIFLCGVACGLLPGIFLGIKVEKFFKREETKLEK